jgi:predicted Zn-ribbon and HTH transcriptional regulator
MELPSLECLKCGHTWHPRTNELPGVCPRCKSPKWQEPNKRKKNSQNESI